MLEKRGFNTLLVGGGIFAVIIYLGILGGLGYVAYLVIMALKKYIGG